MRKGQDVIGVLLFCASKAKMMEKSLYSAENYMSYCTKRSLNNPRPVHLKYIFYQEH